MFKKILVANRGEIACRVAATARRMGVKTVAVYSDADASARHVRACDEAVLIGGPAPRDSYLQWQRIIDAALATVAEAIHPGYGFLSENEEFARACTAAGLVFIGPSAAAIQAMGLKAESKRLMDAAGVPLVPGYHGADQDPTLLRAEAQRIGYPVLIKASAGGGGKGMRAVYEAGEFDAALASCKREAINSFGNDAVLIERYVQRPRHIEIQVFGDNFGECVYLFERDCSVQRRHQKVLEEAPAPGMTAERRAEMGAAAVAAAKAVGYAGAGTVEFICEQDGASAAPGRPKQAGTPSGGSEAQLSVGVGKFYFMEMNTRLQVEHPVTEAITGLDLVEWQLRVASGEPLPLKQAELRMHGHAIEARICAENPDANFLPATGALHVARWPEHVAFERGNLRIDSGVGEGDAISPYYDSMVAKVIVWGEDRAQALARLDAALRDTHIVGLQTNVAFLRRCAATHSFATAELDTALIEREHAALFKQPGLLLEISAAAVVAHTLATEARLQTSDPWSHRDGWRMYGASARRFDLEIAGDHHEVLLSRHHQGGMQLTVGGEAISFAVNSSSQEAHELLLGSGLAQRRVLVKTYSQGETIAVFAPQGSSLVTHIDVLAHAGDGAVEGGGLTAPMPGKLVSFLAQVGDTITKGQPLAVMEAMKMEHTISAPRDGVVAELLFAVGDQVGDGAELLRLQSLS
jgi:3-methylcrotonyl-CoA carboxylase alpha subunit